MTAIFVSNNPARRRIFCASPIPHPGSSKVWSSERDLRRAPPRGVGISSKSPLRGATAALLLGSATSMQEHLESLPEAVGKALEKQGFEQLTPVQRRVLEAAARGGDLRITSQTGSGKTVAVGLLVAQQWPEMGVIPSDSSEQPSCSAQRARSQNPSRSKSAQPRVLIVAPTRELANQVHRELSWLLSPLGLRLVCVTGGTNLSGDRRALSGQPDLLVGTPGRLVDHLRSGRLELSRLHTLVLDEADQMLDLGFREELDAIVEAAPKERRTHFVSATFRDAVGALAQRYQSNIQVIEGTPLGAANADIEHVAHVIREQDTLAAVVNLLLAAGRSRTLVFARTRSDVANLTERLVELGFSAAAISGDLAQAQRERALAAFKSGTAAVLIATDVASRGIHVEDIDLVIQAEAPRDPEVFVHRSGRTGRAGSRGRNVLLVPERGQGRVARMLSQARIKPTFAPVPTAQEVASQQEKQALAALMKPAELDSRWLEMARELCASVEPELAVAKLLSESRALGPCAAMSIQSPAPRQRRERNRQERGLSGARQRGFSEGGQGRNAGVRARGDQFVQFFMNWGRRHGATTGRVLSMACRRGGVQSDAVGSIRIGERSSIVEVHADLAKHFSDRAGKPDSRDPQIQITSMSSGAAAGRPRPGRGKGYVGGGKGYGGDAPVGKARDADPGGNDKTLNKVSSLNKVSKVNWSNPSEVEASASQALGLRKAGLPTRRQERRKQRKLERKAAKQSAARG